MKKEEKQKLLLASYDDWINHGRQVQREEKSKERINGIPYFKLSQTKKINKD